MRVTPPAERVAAEVGVEAARRVTVEHPEQKRREAPPGQVGGDRAEQASPATAPLGVRQEVERVEFPWVGRVPAPLRAAAGEAEHGPRVIRGDPYPALVGRGGQGARPLRLPWCQRQPGEEIVGEETAP